MEYDVYTTSKGQKLYVIDAHEDEFEAIRQIAREKKIAQGDLIGINLWIRKKQKEEYGISTSKQKGFHQVMAIMRTNTYNYIRQECGE